MVISPSAFSDLPLSSISACKFSNLMFPELSKQMLCILFQALGNPTWPRKGEKHMWTIQLSSYDSSVQSDTTHGPRKCNEEGEDCQKTQWARLRRNQTTHTTGSMWNRDQKFQFDRTKKREHTGDMICERYMLTTDHATWKMVVVIRLFWSVTCGVPQGNLLGPLVFWSISSKQNIFCCFGWEITSLSLTKISKQAWTVFKNMKSQLVNNHPQLNDIKHNSMVCQTHPSECLSL